MQTEKQKGKQLKSIKKKDTKQRIQGLQVLICKKQFITFSSFALVGDTFDFPIWPVSGVGKAAVPLFYLQQTALWKGLLKQCIQNEYKITF